MPEDEATAKIVCVALNPAVDRTFEVHNLEIGQHARGRLVSTQPAGKAVNVARVLQHLGQPCILTGFVGEGQRLMFEESFDAKVVQTQLFGVPHPTRENFTLVDAEKGTDLLVKTPYLGQALARTLGGCPAALMRGRGSVTVGETLPRAVGRSIYLELSARMQLQAMSIAGNNGKITFLDEAEVWASVPGQDYNRAWPVWRAKALAGLKSQT